MSQKVTGKYKVLILGGGTGGISVAARLRSHFQAGEIAIIEPSDRHFYQPLWTLVGGGICPKEESERSMRLLIPEGVTWICDAVTEFLPEEKSIKTREGEIYAYDALVVALGMQINWSQVKGLPEIIGRKGVCSNYSYDTVDSTWRFLSEFKGGKMLFTFPISPIKCAGAPQKIMYLAQDYLRRNKLLQHSEITYLATTASIFGVPRYAKPLEKIIADRHIQTHFRNNLIEIRGDKKEAVFENLDTKLQTTHTYDFIHVTPPMGPPDVIRKSKLADAAGYVEVDKHTLQHTRYKDIFSLGDCSSLPCSKTGAAIRKQAPVLVTHVLAHLEGRPLRLAYDGYASCPIVTGYDRLILAEFGYDGKIMETFPFDQTKERYSMYLLKRYALPTLYWRGMMRGLV